MSNGNKNTSFVEANVINSSAKFSFQPPYDFWDHFWIFFRKFSVVVAIKAYLHFPHYKSMETCKLSQQRKHLSNGNKKLNFCRG